MLMPADHVVNIYYNIRGVYKILITVLLYTRERLAVFANNRNPVLLIGRWAVIFDRRGITIVIIVHGAFFIRCRCVSDVIEIMRRTM